MDCIPLEVIGVKSIVVASGGDDTHLFIHLFIHYWTMIELLAWEKLCPDVEL